MRGRSRRTITVAAAILILAAGTAVVVGGFVPAGVRAAGRSVGPAVLVHGLPVPYDGPQRWTTASITSPASRDLVVFATGSTTEGGGPCGPPVLRFRVTESTTAVRVLVAGYQAPSSPATACPAVGYLPSAHTVHLQRSLGSRTVLDAADDHRVTLLDDADYPVVPSVPSGLRAAPLQQWDEGGPVTRSWVVPGSDGPAAITLVVQTPASTREDGPYGRVVRQATIRGVPATVYRGVGTDPGTWFTRWTPNGRQAITLRVSAAGPFRWSADSVFALARTVTGYAVAGRARLGDPTVRGTVAATFSSADGPLRGAPQLLKSSGVFVALDCVGDGRVVVEIRSRSYPFTCTSRLTRHRFESFGAAEATFSVGVEAPAGVRWALSLARASLDGS